MHTMPVLHKYMTRFGPTLVRLLERHKLETHTYSPHFHEEKERQSGRNNSKHGKKCKQDATEV